MRSNSRSSDRCTVIATALIVLTLNTVVLAGDPPPPVPGVCCRPGNVCQPTQNVFADCYSMGFNFIIGASCTPVNPCLPTNTGACCLEGATCQSNLTHEECANLEGHFQGIGSSCTPNPCEGPSFACCFDTAPCQLLTATQCGMQGGVPLDGQFCIDNPCGVGACCTTVNCIDFANAFNCISNGYTFQGVGVPCTPNPCGSFTNACCFNDSTCQELTFNDCIEGGGTPQEQGTTCENAQCGVVACCFPESECMLLSAGACAIQGGILQGGPACTPNPCATGACCTTTNCVPTDFHTCIFNGYSFLGAGTACTPGICLEPCICLGDVNMDFTNNAHDIQAFVNCVTNFNLSCSCADTTGDGQVNAADITQFISVILNSTGECL